MFYWVLSDLVSPETFWIKLDFNLLCVCVIHVLKNPPIPLLVWFYGAPGYTYFLIRFEVCFHIAGHVSHPRKILGAAIALLSSFLHSLASVLQPGDTNIRASTQLAPFIRSPVRFVTFAFDGIRSPPRRYQHSSKQLACHSHPVLSNRTSHPFSGSCVSLSSLRCYFHP